MRGRSRPALVAVLASLPMGAAEARDEAATALARMEMREATLTEQARATDVVARQQAAAAYRLARRRQLGFVPASSARLADAHGLDLAIFALGRTVGEGRAVREELGRVRADRRGLERALAEAAARPPAEGGTPKLLRPCRGPTVAEPGLWRDASTSVVLLQHAVQILGRMNDPVRAPAAGTIRRIEPLPQGGFGLVLEHGGGWVSVIEGLRDVSVEAGATVQAGATLGLVGRNLDTAPVVSVEVWHGRRPVDPRPLLVREP